MLFNARLVAILLAISIATITTAFLSLLKGVGHEAVIITFTIAFSSSFILFYFSLEYLILGEINEAYKVLEKLKKKDFKSAKKKFNPKLSPIKKLNQKIYEYASKKQEEIDQLKKLAIYRREFLADVSHELKTPIFATQGFLHTLIDGAIDDIEVRDKFLNKAASSLDNLNRLVEDLFTLSKMEVGFIKMNYDKFDLQAVLDEVFLELEENAKQKEITLTLDLDPKIKYLTYADRYRIKQVFTNLVNNAIKYGGLGGYVCISLKSDNRNIAVRVEDDGLGIPEEHLERIFERFYRVEKSRSKDKGGTGLGLAIVKHILERHNSKIEVSSKVKKGTVFSFKLNRWTQKKVLKTKDNILPTKP